MLTDEKKEVSLEVKDPTAAKPARKEGALKKLLKQLQSTGNPPLEGEEVMPPKLIGDGNHHWYPLAWTRWLVKWEQFKTLALFFILLALAGVWTSMLRRDSIQVSVPQPAEEMLLKANRFTSFDRQNVESFLHFAIVAANETSSEGGPSSHLLEGSIEPSIYLQIRQRQTAKRANFSTPVTDLPIYTVYVSKFTRWRYNPATRIVSAYAQGFRMMNTIAGKSSMEPYRAMVDVCLEPISNRNRWGYYIQKFDEYYGEAADTFDAALQNSDRTKF